MRVGKLAFALGVGWQASTLLAQPKAFPEAEGFGRLATGARTNLSSASVYHVTNLNNSGAGSFRDAVSQPNRFVVFDVSGAVTLTSTVSVQENITIAGQTAPGGGITLYGAKVSFTGADNTIARYLRVRKGTTTGRDDAVSLADGENMIFDHMSVTWGNDETFSLNPSSGATIDRITVQNSIVGQGLDNVNHSAGGLMTPNGSLSVLRSLFIDNETRNPKVKGVNQFVNNVVYNWTTAAYILGGDSTGDSFANVQSNYFISGPSDTSPGSPFSGANANFRLYADNNLYDSNENGALDGSVLSQASYGPVTWQANPFDYPTVGVDAPAAAYQRIAGNVGPNLHRDEVDTRMIQELTSLGTVGQIVVRESDLYNPYPGPLPSPPKPTDTDNDAIPDAWETANGLNPNDGSDWKTLGVTGYTKLEEYVNGLVSVHADKTWSAASGTWPSGGGWTGGAAPTWDEDAFVRGNGAGTNGNVTISAGSASAFTLAIGGNGDAAAGEKATVSNGGSLLVVDTVTVGHQNKGTLDINAGGSAEAGGGMVLGNVVGAATHVGTLNVNGGTLKTGRIVAGGAGSAMTVNGGTIVANSNPLYAVATTLGASGATIDTDGYSGAFSGNIGGAGGLTKKGAGTLALTGTNTYTGPTVVQDGVLSVSALTNGGVAGNLGAATNSASNLVLDGGTLLYTGTAQSGTDRLFTLTNKGGTLDAGPSGTGQWQFNSTGAIAVPGTGNRTLRLTGGTSLSDFKASLADPAGGGKTSLLKEGSGRWILSAPAVARSYSGDTTINAGTLMTNNDNPLPFGAGKGNLVIASGATFEMNGRNLSINGLSGAGTLNQRGNNTTKTLTLGHGDAGGDFSGILSDVPSTAGTPATLNVVKTGTGTQTLGGANTYEGTTTINGGVLAVTTLANSGIASSIGLSSNAAANLVLDVGTLRHTGPAATSDRLFTVGAGGGTIDASGAGTLTLNGAGAVAMNGTGDRTLALRGSNTGFNNLHLDLADPSSGKTTLTKDGTGTWRLFGNAKTYSGDTNVNGGTLYLVAGNVLPSGAGKGNVNVAAGATLEMFGNSHTINGLSGVGTVTTTANTARTLTVGAGDASGNFAGLLTDGASQTLNLLKTGLGTQTLTGDNNYAGTTVVSGGALLVHGTHTGGGSYTINNGGTLGGNGTIGSAVTVNSGGTLSPGASAGVLSMGSVTLAAGADFVVELDGASDHDQLDVTGTVSVAGADLVAGLNYVPHIGDKLFIVANDGTDAISTRFQNLPDGGLLNLTSSADLQSYTFQISYAGDAGLNTTTGGNDVVLTAIPEPTVAGALLAIAMTGVVSRRRRR